MIPLHNVNTLLASDFVHVCTECGKITQLLQKCHSYFEGLHLYLQSFNHLNYTCHYSNIKLVGIRGTSGPSSHHGALGCAPGAARKGGSNGATFRPLCVIFRLHYLKRNNVFLLPYQQNHNHRTTD